MATGYYALDHPNPNAVRWGNPLGFWGYSTMNNEPQAIVLHTTEGIADLDGPDSGAENVANWFQTNDTFALYQTLVDSDSRVRMVPAGLDGTQPMTAFHAAGYNSRTLGCSMAMRADSWPFLPLEWQERTLNNAAAEVALWCLRWNIPVRKVTKAQVDAGERGITGHGILDPGYRSDPGTGFDWDGFIKRVQNILNGMPLGPAVISTSGDARTLVLEDNFMIHNAVKRQGLFNYEGVDWEVYDILHATIDGTPLGTKVIQHSALVVAPVDPATTANGGHTVVVFKSGERYSNGKIEPTFGVEKITLQPYGAWKVTDVAGRWTVLSRPNQPVHVFVRELSYLA